MKAAFHSQESFPKIILKKPSRVSAELGGKVITDPGVDIPDLAPGEPVPPGFEDMVTRVPEITSTLNEMKAPLIGLEFLAEITPVGDEVEPKYCCLLCNKRGDPRTVLAHLVCFNHRIKYIGRYFPKVNVALALIPKVKEYKRGTGEVLARIVKEIENKFGRLSPVIVDGSVFDEKKEECYLEMCAGIHFRETSDSNLESLVDLEFIKKCAPEAENVLTIDVEQEEAKRKSTALKHDVNLKNRNKNISDQLKKNVDKSSNKVVPRRKRERSIQMISITSSNSRSRSRSRSWTRSRSASRSRSWSRSRSRSRSRYRYIYRDYKRDEGRRRSPRYYRRSRSRSRNKTSSYGHYRSSGYKRRSPLSGRETYRSIRYDSLYEDERYSLSDKPKSTQLKVAELRDKRRKKDLYHEYVIKLEKDMSKILKGHEKNPEKHPSYPEEWKKFWNRRYKELTSEGIDASKHDFKPEWIKFWTVRMKELHNEELQMKKEKYRTELGLVDTDSSGALDSDVIEVSPTPLEDDKSNITVEDIKNTWKVLTGGEIRGAASATLSPEKVDDKEDVLHPELNQPVRVITVLRLLTALESQLGSLGPRVNNLLAQAIALEKKRENSSDSLIDVSENNVLFETVKEKLKGQLFAGIVEKHLVKATRTAIQNVAELFNLWKAKKNNPENSLIAANPSTITGQTVVQTSTLTAPSDPLIVPGIGAVDKLAIAQQIASALVAQGKTNVTEQELEQLINAVVGMAQASSTPQPQAYFPAASPVTQSGTLTSSTASVHSPMAAADMKGDDDSDNMHKLAIHLQPTSEKSDCSIFGKLEPSGDEQILANNAVLSCKKLFLRDVTDFSEDDIKSSLQKFKDLSSEEQQRLITHLKEMEAKDPVSVENLRKFVQSAGENITKMDLKFKDDPQITGRLSPFSMREGGANPFIDDRSKSHIKEMDDVKNRIDKCKDDDEDDDDDNSSSSSSSSYEEIFKPKEKKISGKSIVEQMIAEQQKKSKRQFGLSPKNDESLKSPENRNKSVSLKDDPECVLSEAKVMIDNIMGQLPSKFTGASTRLSSSHNVKVNSSMMNSRSTSLGENRSMRSSTVYQMYDNVTHKVPENNLLNDFNYQDDLFGYSNENYQNYSVENEGNYHCESNLEPSYGLRHSSEYNNYNKTVEPGYNYEAWNENYSQYPPPQMTNYECPQMVSQSAPPGFNGPEVFQVPPNDFGRPPAPYGNNMYREYY